MNTIKLILIYHQNFIFQSSTTTTLPIRQKSQDFSLFSMFYEPASGLFRKIFHFFINTFFIHFLDIYEAGATMTDRRKKRMFTRLEKRAFSVSCDVSFRGTDTTDI
jgi:hypothetical protein